MSWYWNGMIFTNKHVNTISFIKLDRLQSQGIPETLITPIKIEQKEMSEQNASIHLLAMLIPFIAVT
ncbi:MAG: hypothetical protein ACI35O_06300 [Bacillaceae bacterium]